MTAVFRTILISNGKIINWKDQLNQLEKDAGRPVSIPSFSIPDTGNYRLRITADIETLIEIEPYTPPASIHLTLYPDPINGDKIKSFSYRNRGFIRDYAKGKGADDALIICSDGYLTEASNANFFFELDNRFYTPNPDLPFLFGLTIRSLNYSFEFVKMKPRELPRGAKFYLCNSLMGVIPATYFSG